MFRSQLHGIPRETKIQTEGLIVSFLFAREIIFFRKNSLFALSLSSFKLYFRSENKFYCIFLWETQNKILYQIIVLMEESKLRMKILAYVRLGE